MDRTPYATVASARSDGAPLTETVATFESELLLSVVHDRYGVDVAQLPTGRWIVAWTDHVTNEWQREVPTLAAAFLVLALLERCEASDWSRGIPAEGPELDVALLGFANLMDDVTGEQS